MFVHNFKYTLKTLLKNKMLIFWTFAFPIILGTFFSLAFSEIEDNEKLDIIDIAIISNDNFNNNEMYKEVFETLSNKDNQDRLFNIDYVDKTKAKELLNNDEITGYIEATNDDMKVVIKNNGINETILKYVTEEIRQTEFMVNDLAKEKIAKEVKDGNFNIDYEEIYNNVLKMVSDKNINIKDTSSNNLSYTMIEFYTLIAMTCLYGGIIGMISINQNLANMSSNGKRVEVSPVSKKVLVFSSVVASYIIQVVGILALFLYTIFVLQVDYGSNLFLVVLLALVGCLAGLSLGIFVSSIFKVNDNVKTGIIISVTMLGCFFSGMMGITMKYIIDKNIPIVNKLNPASMITDGFYSLYYYDTLDRFYFNLVSLLIFACVMIIVSIFSLRRQKYDSI